MITKSHNHNHFWILDEILYESYNTIRGLRYRALIQVKGFEDTDKCSDMQINEINNKFFKF